MYAYVDETGNTGNRIFDLDQPLFITAAMMTRANFDAVQKAAVAAIAKKAGVHELHANEMGVAKVEEIANDILKIVKVAQARFFLSRLEKRYLGATKVIDTYFDSGENLAVPWQAYSIRHLRLLLAFKVATYVLTDEIAQTVWNCLTAKKEGASLALFIEGAKAMLARAHNLPDARSRQIVTEAMQWAIDNPESFSFHTKNKALRFSHSPNHVAFSALVIGIDEAPNTWKSPVREIVHDRQLELEETLRYHHEIVTNASDQILRWPGDPPMSMRQVPGSVLRMVTDQPSPGLQVIDVILWLFKRTLTDRDIGPESARLLQQVFRRGKQNDFSFAGVSNQVKAAMQMINDAPLGDDQLEFGRNFVAKSEERRQAAMKAYGAEKARAQSAAD
jgi:hypothetical protein